MEWIGNVGQTHISRGKCKELKLLDGQWSKTLKRGHGLHPICTQQCTELTSRFAVAAFYGRHSDVSIQLLSLWNQTARQQKEKEFYLTPAPFTQADGGLEYHLNLLRDRLKQEKKSVHLSEFSKLPGHLAELSEDFAPIARDTDFPALSALCYAVSASTVFDRAADDLRVE
jgi:hypothetical protein